MLRSALIAVGITLAASVAWAGVDEPSPLLLRTMVLMDEAPALGHKGWDPHAVRAMVTDKVMGFLPDGIIEDVARSFANQTLTVELGPDRAFVRLRLPL